MYEEAYEELVELLYHCVCCENKCGDPCRYSSETACVPELMSDAGDAILNLRSHLVNRMQVIEELTRKVEILEKQIDDGVEAGKKAIIGVERYVSQIQEKVNSLDDHQHYSGRYIKSIMGGVSNGDDK